ncbi:MAG: hypothetical protein AAB452_01520 [Patescibacteria group bacterium]
MNFLANKLEFISSKQVSALDRLSVRIMLGAAGVVIFLEFLILWQFIRPVSLVLGEPTQAPRPEEQRVGILKRF